MQEKVKQVNKPIAALSFPDNSSEKTDTLNNVKTSTNPSKEMSNIDITNIANNKGRSFKGILRYSPISILLKR